MGTKIIIPNADFSENGILFYNILKMKIEKGKTASYITNPSSVSFASGALDITGGTTRSAVGTGEMEDVLSLTGIERIIFGNLDADSPITEIEVYDTDKSINNWEMMFYSKGYFTNVNKNFLKNVTRLTLEGNVPASTGLYHTFEGLTGLQFADLRKLDTSKANDFSYMFRGCASLIELDLTNWSTQSMASGNYMFALCTGLKSLKLGPQFTLAAANNLTRAFYGLFNLDYLDLRYVSPKATCNLTEIFKDSNYKEINLTSFPASHTGSKTSMFNGCSYLEKVYCSASNYSWIKTQLETDLATVTIGGVTYTCTWTYLDGVITRTLS